MLSLSFAHAPEIPPSLSLHLVSLDFFVLKVIKDLS